MERYGRMAGIFENDKCIVEMRIEIEQIIELLAENVISVKGVCDGLFVDNLADVEHTVETTLDWINHSRKNAQQIAENTRAKVILVGDNVVYSDKIKAEGKVLIVVRDTRMAIAKVGNHFFSERYEPGIHPTAVIDPEAKIGANVHIGAYTVIGKAKIGDNSVIDSQVKIHDGVEIGHDCKIFAQVVLGGQSFGPEKDEDGNLFRFPQLGRLIIGNYVEIASMTCVDKGALSDTIIGDYTKIDGLCKIAHNNVIGKNVVITGCVSMAGSNVIEDGCWIGPNSSFHEWGHVGKDAFVGMGSVIFRKVKDGQKVFGNPAKVIDFD